EATAARNTTTTTAMMRTMMSTVDTRSGIAFGSLGSVAARAGHGRPETAARRHARMGRYRTVVRTSLPSQALPLTSCRVARGRRTGLRRVPAKAHRVEPLDRLLGQGAGAAHDAEAQPRARLE